MTATAHTEALLEALRRNLHVLNELAVRYEVETDPGRADEASAITCPDDVQRLLGAEMGALCQEQVRVLLLDRRNRVTGQRVIYQGNCFSSVVRPAEVLRPAVLEGVPHLIVAHNHPSSDPSPSPQDVKVTRELAEAAKLLGLELLDHVVIGGDEAVSLKDRGLLD
ncbi:MAG: DNA repair protein RadC [Chloroflexi bacterium]|nr:DNA repair protein RadC [Chloroflexota bacterium]